MAGWSPNPVTGAVMSTSLEPKLRSTEKEGISKTSVPIRGTSISMDGLMMSVPVRFTTAE